MVHNDLVVVVGFCVVVVNDDVVVVSIGVVVSGKCVVTSRTVSQYFPLTPSGHTHVFFPVTRTHTPLFRQKLVEQKAAVVWLLVAVVAVEGRERSCML